MKTFKLCTVVVLALLMVKSLYAEPLLSKQRVYQDGAVDSLLKAETSQDGKEAILTKVIDATEDNAFLARLYCQRGKLRITHTHLPKGIKDLEACINKLELAPKANAKRIEDVKQALDHATRKYDFTKRLVNNKAKPLVVRFTALWKLGQREKAVLLVKAEATPENFSTMSANRMLGAAYLCKGAGPNGPDKSFKTKKLSPLWWCDELLKPGKNKTLKDTDASVASPPVNLPLKDQ